MLENATRICEAKFGGAIGPEDDGFRSVATLRPAAGRMSRSDNANRSIRPHPQRPVSAVSRARNRSCTSPTDGGARPTSIATRRSGGGEIGGVRTLLVVPMLKENELVGVIAIYRQEVRPFTDKQIELVTTSPRRRSSPSRTRACSTSCAESLQQQTATADVLKVISRSTFDLQAVLDTLRRIGGATVRGRNRHPFAPVRGRRLSPRGELRHLRRIRANTCATRIRSSRAEARLSGEQRSKAGTVHMPDVAGRPGIHLGEARELRWPSHHARRPAAARRTPIGVIIIYRQQVRPFTDKQIELVHHLRRPGGDRDRERAAVRRGAGAHPRARAVGRGVARARRRHPGGELDRSTCRRCSTPSSTKATQLSGTEAGAIYVFDEASKAVPVARDLRNDRRT